MVLFIWGQRHCMVRRAVTVIIIDKNTIHNELTTYLKGEVLFKQTDLEKVLVNLTIG